LVVNAAATIRLLLSPVLAFLMAIAVEILIGLLIEAGAAAFIAIIATGVIGWLLLHRLRVRPEGGAENWT
jgi:hypothetical protein